MRWVSSLLFLLFYGCNPALAISYVPNEFSCKPSGDANVSRFHRFMDSDVIEKMHLGIRTFSVDRDTDTLTVPSQTILATMCVPRKDKTIYCGTFDQSARFIVNQFGMALIIPLHEEISPIGVIALKCEKK